MKTFILSLILATLTLGFTWSPVQSKSYPVWADQSCSETIYKIVQHEAGYTYDNEIFEFLAEQVARDVTRLGCDHLTQWRWRIGYYPLEKVSTQVKESVDLVLERYPKINYPKCQFIGSKYDIPVWQYYGYNTLIGYEKTANNLTVIGVNCTAP